PRGSATAWRGSRAGSVGGRMLKAASLPELGLGLFASTLWLAAHAQQVPPGYGEQPVLPSPRRSWLPTLHWSVASEPWQDNQTPKAATSLEVIAFARGLKHPRWLYVVGNGDVLVAEAATEPLASWSPLAIVQDMVQRRTGAIVENANRISLLR